MKTSFYFVLWILIYPILGLLDNSFVNENAFVIALIVVWGLSWLLNRMMPEIITYDNALQAAPILEDIYTDDIRSFGKRLSRDAIIETITSVYFILTTFVICIVMFKLGGSDWIGLVVFGFLAYGAIARSIRLMRARTSLKSNPTVEECMNIAGDTYGLDYASYYAAHVDATYEEMLPPKPRYFRVFQIFSFIVSVVCALLGLLYVILGLTIMLSETSVGAGALAGMYFLYGALATYFGIKDLISSVKNNATRKRKVL